MVHLDWDKLDSFSHAVVVTPKSISLVCSYLLLMFFEAEVCYRLYC